MNPTHHGAMPLPSLLLPLLLSVLVAPFAFAGVPVGSFGGYLSLSEGRAWLQGVRDALGPDVSRFPVRLGEGQDTTTVRPIEALCLGRCSDAATEPAALYTSLHHAREPMSLASVLYSIDDLRNRYLAKDPEVQALLQLRQLWFVPFVNPDGYELNMRLAPGGGGMQRKNTRPTCGGGARFDTGVDLNRNYPVCFADPLISGGWAGSSTKPCDEDYRGSASFSEPETQAIRTLVQRVKFSTALNYHSFGRMINLPYSCKSKGHPKGQDYGTFLFLGNMLAKAKPSTAVEYSVGAPWENGLYTVNGDASDWMYEDMGIYAMSPEVGPDEHHGAHLTDMQGFWPAKNYIPTIGPENVNSDRLLAWHAGGHLDLDQSKSSVCLLKGSATTHHDVTLNVINRGLRPTVGDAVNVVVAWVHQESSSVSDIVVDSCAYGTMPGPLSARSSTFPFTVAGLRKDAHQSRLNEPDQALWVALYDAGTCSMFVMSSTGAADAQCAGDGGTSYSTTKRPNQWQASFTELVCSARCKRLVACAGALANATSSVPSPSTPPHTDHSASPVPAPSSPSSPSNPSNHESTPPSTSPSPAASIGAGAGAPSPSPASSPVASTPSSSSASSSSSHGSTATPSAFPTTGTDHVGISRTVPEYVYYRGISLGRRARRHISQCVSGVVVPTGELMFTAAASFVAWDFTSPTTCNFTRQYRTRQ